MAEQSKPNTFSGGMITDLDPSYQPKESYFTGLNIRVITNGDNSYSLENIQGPKNSYDTNRYKHSGEDSVPTLYLTGDSRCAIHGAVVVDDYIITIEATVVTTNKVWKIRKYLISSNGELTNPQGFNTTEPLHLWSGTGLFSDNAGEIEMESIAETENIHRIYCTDGISPLLSINVKADISANQVSDFVAFKPNIMAQASISGYNSTGGSLKYGAYSYTYRLASVGQANYSDWAPLSRPINIVKGNLAIKDGLTIKGESGAEVSSKTVKLSITGISTEYEIIEIAAVHYSSENIPTIEVIEQGSIISSTYDLLHSGFETTTLVSGGIAAAIISNKTWNVCKTLGQKDNKLFAGNLSGSPMNIDISAYKVKSYKITGDGSGGDPFVYTAHTEEANPHRHQNGSGGVRIFDQTNPSQDRQHYKFLGKTFPTSTDPNAEHHVLGAETPGYSSSAANGFRISFDQVGYLIDETGSWETYAGELLPEYSLGGGTWQNKYEAIPYQVSSGQNHADWGGGKPGPHNPVWDNKYRSFKRGECYRFAIVFYDLQGVPGFAHHIGDVKMPEAMDLNNYKLTTSGDSAEHNRSGSINGSTAHTVNETSFIQGWQPFVKITHSMDRSSSTANSKEHYGWALIPRIDVRLPDSIKNQISGYKIVRAELQDNDKTIITQGVLNKCTEHHSTEGLSSLKGKLLCADFPYSYVRSDSDTISNNPSAHPDRINNSAYTLDTPDVTIGGKSYDFSSGGFDLRLLCPITMGNERLIHGNGSSSHALDSAAVGTTGLTYGGAGATVVDDDKLLAQYTMTVGGADVNGYDYALGFRYSWMTKADLGVSTDTVTQFDITALKNPANDTGLFMIYKNINYGKSVVANELVSTSESGLSDAFQNSVGESEYNYLTAYYGQASLSLNEKRRAEFTGSGCSTIFLALDSAATETSYIKYENSYDYVGVSLGKFANTGGSAWHDNKTYRGISSKWLAEIVRDTTSTFEQYGGYTVSAIENTRFYDCSNYQSKSVTTFHINGGDVFCDFYTYKNTIPSGETTSSSSAAGSTAYPGLTKYYNTSVPIESSYNLSLRQGVYFGSSKEVTQAGEDNYLYNTAYNQEPNLVGSTVKPAYWDENNIFRAKIAASRTKIPGEPFDAWSEFPANDFIELNLKQGSVTDIVNYKDRLYGIQDSGVSVLSVNPRALIAAEGAAADIQIVSGTGAAIERYDYITTKYGSQHYNKSLVTPTGFYFLDAENSELVKISEQGLNPLSLTNQYKSYISNITDDKSILVSENGNIGSLTKGVFSGYDSEFRECHFTIVDSDSTKSSFTVSDLDGKLISSLELLSDDIVLGGGGGENTFVGSSIFFKKYISYRNRLFGVGHETSTSSNDSIYLFNSDVYQNFNVGFVVNDNSTINKIFDTSEIISDTAHTFTSHTLADSTSSNAVSGSNERIREGVHRVSLRGEDTGRARGNWLKHTIAYNQTLASGSIDSSADKKFNIFAVNTRYRQSR